MLQNELEKLYRKYKQREIESLDHVEIPEGKYLCIRMDGFKASKNHLKDVLINKRFNEGMKNGYENLFYSFRHYFTNEYSSAILAALIINDEVSIILNNKNEADDAKRIMKITTLFAGMMSSNTYIKGSKNKGRKYIAFDARPILLDEDEIAEYIRHRYLIAVRYAHWKVLRLDGLIEENDNEAKFNINTAMSLTREHEVYDKAQKLIATYTFLLTEREQRPAYKKIDLTKDAMTLDSIKQHMRDCLNYCSSLTTK